MGYYTQQDLPFYYWMAKTFGISDRHFCSLLGPTWPNRFFFYGSTAWGNIKTEEINPITADTFNNATHITDQMVAAGKTWKIYKDGLVSFATVWGLTTENLGVPMSQFAKDVANDTLPNLVIIDPNFTGSGQNDEHPPSNIQQGQKFTASVYATLTSNPAVWAKTVFIVTYDEHGGYYDHVAPPPACEPDKLPPPATTPYQKYDRLGFRVPLLVASPYAKKSYVSHFVTDLTSITRFIQNRFDLPSMTVRDSNAWPMLDMFDFQNPPFVTPPTGAPSADPDPAGVTWCANNPPGTGKP
jgi:phospholipase C